MALYGITGGAGFIGSHLADTLLDRGHQVRVLDDLSTGRLAHLDRRCAFMRGDAADPAVVRDLLDGVDGCFHLAAIASVERASREWLAAHRVNQTATITVLDAARALGGIPVVYASSAAVYGDINDTIAHEDMLPAPLTAYGADKLGSELHARVAFLVHGVPTLGFRFFNVYGPRQDPASQYSGVISIFARRIAAGLPITIHGEGEQVRDFVHVTDVAEHLVRGMIHLGRFPGARVLNVCRGLGTSVLDLANLIGTVESRTPRITFGAARVGDIRNSVGDPSLATSMLGIAAQIDLAAGLTSLAQAYQQPEMAMQSSAHG